MHHHHRTGMCKRICIALAGLLFACMATAAPPQLDTSPTLTAATPAKAVQPAPSHTFTLTAHDAVVVPSVASLATAPRLCSATFAADTYTALTSLPTVAKREYEPVGWRAA